MATLSPDTLDKWAGLRMAHEAAMVDDLASVLKADRQTVAAHRRAMGLETEPEEPNVIHVGDVTYQQPPAAPAAAPASRLGTLAKLGIGAALLGSGAAVPLAIDALRDRDPPAAEAEFYPSKWELVIPKQGQK
jgi:hypothetical protein